MTSLASATFSCSALAAMFKLAGFRTTEVMDTQASLRVSSTLLLRLTALHLLPKILVTLKRTSRWGARVGSCPN
uniref:Uncharacterized protein n=1 Tax=Mandrillus leucophaeus TaxID=9568 RepID=A0A2K5XKF0_MANLE